MKKVFALLNEMVEEGVIESYAIGGAVAAVNYLEPMSTSDVDVFVHIETPNSRILLDPTPIFEFCASRGYGMEDGYVVVGDWPVQFLAPPGNLGEEALENARYVEVEGIPVRILGAEYLAAIALETGRPKDKSRVLAFLESQSFDRAKFEDIVLRCNLEDLWKRFKGDFRLD